MHRNFRSTLLYHIRSLLRQLLTLMLVLERKCGLVAHLCRPEILDGARIDVACVISPLVALCSEFLERCTIKTHKGFLDNGLHHAVTALHIHHHSDRDTTGNPLHRRLCKVTHRRHVTCHTATDKACGIETERVAVVSIEVGRICATAFVTEEVMQ